MRTTDFNQQPTAAKLNESMFKKFGSKINFEKYTREQLEDYRNLLRTKVDQTESAAGFNDLLANESYQKDKYMLGVLNTKIKEMLGESKVLAEKAVSKSQQQAAGIALAAKKAGKKATGGKASAEMSKMSTKELEKFAGTKHKGLPKKVKEDAKPDFLDMDKDGNKKEPFKKAVKDAKACGPSCTCAKCKAKKTTEGYDTRDAYEKHDPKHPDFKKNYEKFKKTNPSKTLADFVAKMKGSKIKEAAADTLPPVDKDAAAKRKANQAKLDAIADKRAEKDSGTTQSSTRKVGGSAYGGSKQKDTEVDEGKKMAKKAKPDFLDVDKDGNKKEPFKKAVKDKKAVKEGARRAHQYIIIESLRKFIAEDEEGKAKDITAGTDMVNDFTSWMQRVGQYQTKSMIELADSIRANFGQAEADAFKSAITPALQEALAALTQSRESITRAVAVLAGEEAAQEPMGAETPDLTGDAGMDDLAPDAGLDTMNEPGDEFGASDAAAGGEESSGRGMRESRAFNRAKKLAESHSIMSKLAR